MTYSNAEFLRMQNSVFKTNYTKTIAFDMDDVLALFGEGFMDLYNERYNDSLTTEDMIDWDMAKFVKPVCGNKIYDLLKEPGLFRYLKPAPHAKEVIERLQQRGFEIIIISDSPKGDSFSDYIWNPEKVANPADDKRAWVLENFPMIPQENINFIGQKFRVRFDVLIDDKPDTFLKFSELGLNVILVDRPYNRFIQTEKRVMSLLEAEEMIYNMFYEKTL